MSCISADASFPLRDLLKGKVTCKLNSEENEGGIVSSSEFDYEYDQFMLRLAQSGIPPEGKIASDDARKLILKGTAPAGLRVAGKLDLSNTVCLELPDGLQVDYLVMRNCKFPNLPQGLRAGVLDLTGCSQLESLPSGITCNILEMAGTPITCLPHDLRVKNRINLRASSSLTSLPHGFNCATISLRDCPNIRSLPELIDVNYLDVSNCTSLEEWPKHGRVRFGWLTARGCPALRYLPGWIGPIPEVDVIDCQNLVKIEEGANVTSWIDIAGTALRSLPDSLNGTQIRWRRVPVTKKMAFEPETISVTEVLDTGNLALRRALIDRMGYERFLREAEPEVLDKDHDGGGERLLLRLRMRGDENLVCVKVVCPSTGHNYVLRVPPYMESCRQSVAWIAGFTNPNDYMPLKET